MVLHNQDRLVVHAYTDTRYYVITYSFIPIDPHGPRWPVSPLGPGGPISPLRPVSPLLPGGPCGPGIPSLQ